MNEIIEPKAKAFLLKYHAILFTASLNASVLAEITCFPARELPSQLA